MFYSFLNTPLVLVNDHGMQQWFQFHDSSRERKHCYFLYKRINIDFYYKHELSPIFIGWEVNNIDCIPFNNLKIELWLWIAPENWNNGSSI